MSEIKDKIVEEIKRQSQGAITEGSEEFETVLKTVLDNLDEEGTEEDLETEVKYVLEDEGII